MEDLSHNSLSYGVLIWINSLGAGRRTVNAVAESANDASDAGNADSIGSPTFSFLPKSLIAQCRSLIESYHDLHGYTCLPDVLWKAGLGPFIQTHREFRHLLKKASTTRSAKRSNEGFVQIATTLLSLEILASSFAGWSTLYPQAASRAQAILKRTARSPHMPLMEFYLYPPKHISSAAIAALAPPASRQPSQAELYKASKPELAGEKMALNYIHAMKQALDEGPAMAAPDSTT
jgi:hypothetical protein